MDKTPAAVPPVIEPTRWEDFEGFRETFLAWFTEPQQNATLRALGLTLDTLIHEAFSVFPDPPEGPLVHRLRAIVADLRYLEGALGELGDPEQYLPKPDEDEGLCRLSRRKAVSLKKMADSLEAALPAVAGGKAETLTAQEEVA